MIFNKKGQGLGGFLKVVVIGVMFLSFFPFLNVALSESSSQHTGATSFLIDFILIVIVYLFISFAYNLGAD